jgi:hypothetical protein
MKKLIILLVAATALCYINTNAQNSAKMLIHKMNKSTVTYNLSEIDSITFTPCEICNENILFFDNFETYPLDTLPLSSGYVLQNGGLTNQKIEVTNSEYHSPTKSLLIYNSNGGGALGINQVISSFPDITYFEISIKSPTSSNDDTEAIVAFGIRFYLAINFVPKDKNIVLTDYYTENTGYSKELNKYNDNQWYKIKVKYDKINKKVTCWVNDNLAFKDEVIQPYESGTLEINFAGVNKSNYNWYFDDFKVWECK